MADSAPVERAGRKATLTLLEYTLPHRVELCEDSSKSEWQFCIHDKSYVGRLKADWLIVVVNAIEVLLLCRQTAPVKG